MEKTKLNIPVAIVAAAAWLLGLYGGYVITGILIGYVLLKEENLWLRKNCLRVLILMLTFSVASTAINLLPNLLELLYSFLRIFKVNFYLDFVHSVFNLFYSVISLIKTLLFLLLGITAAMNKDFKLPVLDPFIEKITN